MNYDAIKHNLTKTDIINILQYFYPSLPFIEKEDALIFPTICHNEDCHNSSFKLYYYDNTHLFRCYTECNEYFDIFQLMRNILIRRGEASDFYNIASIISFQTKTTFSFDKKKTNEYYESIADRYNKNNTNQPTIKVYEEKLLNKYSEFFPLAWLEEGISKKSMKKFGIKIDVLNEQIIIPHRNVDGCLIGIRVRNLEPLAIENGAKYMPAKINGAYIAHPLMYNLYGLYENKENIQKYKMAWIFEGEKSVMKVNDWYRDSCAVASCGDKINKFQIKLLLDLGVREIIICYDRMNKDRSSDIAYYNKLMELCKKYCHYANFYFVFDKNYVLEYKSAPVDKDKSTFEKLLRERIVVR